MTVTSIQSILRSNLPRGPVGSTGFTGSEGFTGSQGFTGSRGEGFTIDGAVLTEQDLANIVNPQLGDVYLVEQTGEVWIYDGQQFANIGQFVGYTGSQGELGYTGSQGEGFTGSQGDIGYTGSAGGVTYTVTNSGAGDYLIAGAADPTLTLVKGATYYFSVNAPGHPFWIKTEQVTGTGSNYTSGVTNNGVDSGIVTFSVPFDAPSTLYYICQYHSSMSGILNIVESINGYTGSQGDTGYIGSQGYTGSVGELGYTGSQGDQGNPGDPGFTGSRGDDGTSITIRGTFATVANLPDDSSGFVGDAYVIVETGEIWVWDGSNWNNGGRFVGYTGSQGVSGPIGFTGSAGSGGTGGGARYINLVMSGEITPPIVGQARFYPPESLTITKIYASISSQATGGAFTFQLNKNGVNTGVTLLIPSGSFTMIPVITSILVNSGDYLTLDITGVGSRDLHIKMEYELSV